MEATQDHLAFRGFEVWIVVDGVKTPIYGIEHNEVDGKVSCWISSTTDKEFSIGFTRTVLDICDYSGAVTLDGHLVANNVYRNQDRVKTRRIASSRVSNNEVRNFVFGSLELTDDDSHLEDPSAQNIGEIKVDIQRVQTLGLAKPHGPDIFAVPNAGKVHERSKKGLAHQIKYGPAQQRAGHNQHFKISYVGVPYTFVFKYRPLELTEMLRATGIAPPLLPPPKERQLTPRSASPPNMPKKRNRDAVKIELSDDDESGDDDDDIEDMAAKERELLAELEKVRSKQRAQKDGARSKKKIKREPTSTRTFFTPGEVIDLT